MNENEKTGGKDPKEDSPPVPRLEDRCHKWIGLAMPLVVAVLGTVIAWLGHSFQQSFSTIQLRAQREQGDTTIRAELFKSITDRLLREDKDKGIMPDRDAVLAEMLALNFHEQIELKPLMVDIERRLDKATKDDAKEWNEAKEELRSVARRVRARQTAMLMNVWQDSPIKSSQASLLGGTNGQQEKQHAYIRYFTAVRKGNKDEHPLRVEQGVGQNGCIGELFEDKLPDGKHFLFLSVVKSDWKKDQFEIHIKIGEPDKTIIDTLNKGVDEVKGKGLRVEECVENTIVGRDDKVRATGSGLQQLVVTWFDFPLTDNTLVKFSPGEGDDIRYALFIDEVFHSDDYGIRKEEDHWDAVRLGLLYFPEDYIPSRERPENYKEVNKQLGLRK